MSTGTELLHDEVIYRRIPKKLADEGGWIGADGKIDPVAFYPNRGDLTGISFTRASSFEAAAKLQPKGKIFYLVSLSVSQLAQFPLDPDSPSHVELRGWTYERRKAKDVQEGAEYLASICSEHHGPYEGEALG